MFESQDILSGSSAKTEGSAPERAWTGAAAMALAVSAVFAGVVGCGKTSAGGDVTFEVAQLVDHQSAGRRANH
jgi:hypothetical protein